ncbi:MAG: glycosyl transferase, partial [Nocardioidaceae bacterium]|nr:glycosyl transferase [Nocardioidaceae bacterium]
VVPPGEPDLLAAALDALSVPDARRRLGDSGRRYVQRDYELRSCTDRFVDLLGTLHVRSSEGVHV